MQYQIISSTNSDDEYVVALVDGQLLSAGSEHPNYDTIVNALRSNNVSANFAELFDLSRAVKTIFEEVSERVSVANGRVYFDGDEIDNALSKAILRFMDQDVHRDKFASLVAFFENVMDNPDEHSRTQLYDWLDRHGDQFPITPNGHLIAYKGVLKSGDIYTSIHYGTAIVNGQTVTGQIPYAVGDVVTMPRSEVQSDPSVGCHKGLHAGTWDYASSFSGGLVMKVEINPRDVVSVPTDCNAQKVRVCRMGILEFTDNRLDSAYYDDYSDGTDDNECDYCESWDEDCDYC